MHKREKEALADLHADDKDKVNLDKDPVVITGINFKVVNEIYDSRKSR